MESDLLFTLVKKQEWKEYAGIGQLETPSFTENGYLICFESAQVEPYANAKFEGENDLFLLIIDPLRIQHPVKKEKTEQGQEVRIFGAISIDAVIDRIPLKRSKKGSFSVHIKHFD